MQTRLDFLAGGAVAALTPVVAAASPAPSPSPAASPPAVPKPMPKLAFDLAAFDATLATQATHRHMFASTKLEGGLVLGQMRGVLDAYNEIGIKSSDVHPVAVLYHGVSTLLGFDDTIWNKYFIPVASKMTASMAEQSKDFGTVYTAGKTTGNPCLHKTGTDDDSSIESLVADAGARFFICNNATKGFASYIARELKLDRIAVYKEFAAHVVPNGMLVPAGIWAVAAVQERRYTYQQSTLQS